MLFVATVVMAQTAPPAPKGDATITSDELVLQDSGAKSVFRGNVVLKQDPYTLFADRMERKRDGGVVEVFGNVHGSWTSEKGERLLATGQRGRYVPETQTIELWEKAKLTRWETAVDTTPVVVKAHYFIAYRDEKTVWAKKNVFMEQGIRMKAQSDFARYDQVEQALHLWGDKQVAIHVEDAKGKADFLSDKAKVTLTPKGARLMDRVTGHVVPSKT